MSDDPARKTHDAWDVHQALTLAEQRNPKLRHNPLWRAMRDEARLAFTQAFEDMA